MKDFLAGQPTRAKKGKTQGRRRTRSKQPGGLKKALEIRSPGPAQGFRLSYDPNDEHFPKKWVLSYKDLVLLVSHRQPTDLWDELTSLHKTLSKMRFEPVPQDRQDIRRRWANEEFQRIDFWERVWTHGRKKHSHPDRGDSYLVIVQNRKEKARVALGGSNG